MLANAHLGEGTPSVGLLHPARIASDSPSSFDNHSTILPAAPARSSSDVAPSPAVAATTSASVKLCLHASVSSSFFAKAAFTSSFEKVNRSMVETTTVSSSSSGASEEEATISRMRVAQSVPVMSTTVEASRRREIRRLRACGVLLLREKEASDCSRRARC